MEHIFPPPGTLLIAKEEVPFYTKLRSENNLGEEVEYWQTPWSDEKRFLTKGEPVLFLGIISFRTPDDWTGTTLETVYCFELLMDERVVRVEIDGDKPSQDLFDSLFEVCHAE